MKAFNGRSSRKKSNFVAVSGKFEKMLLITFTVVFALLIFIQAAIFNPFFSKFFTDEYALEGVPLKYEEFLYKEGSLKISIMGNEIDYDMNYDVEYDETYGKTYNKANDLKLLINGDPVYDFSNSIYEIKVRDGDVVEIDGSYLTKSTEVKILSKSDNMVNECVGKIFVIGSKIEKLIKVKLN